MKECERIEDLNKFTILLDKYTHTHSVQQSHIYNAQQSDVEFLLIF